MEIERKSKRIKQYWLYRAICNVWSNYLQRRLVLSNLTENNNSEEFIKFINKLIIWLWEDLKINIMNLVLMIDNSPVHTSRNSMKNLNELKCQVVFLPPYTPQLAPIEMMFHVMKRKIYKHSEGEEIRLCSKDRMRTIKETLATFTNEKLLVSGQK